MGLVYERHTLPQLSEDTLVHSYRKYWEAPAQLVPSQNERVPALLIKARKKFPNIKPIVIDQDNNIVNGHHRYDVALELGVTSVPVVKVNASIKELISYYKNSS